MDVFLKIHIHSKLIKNVAMKEGIVEIRVLLKN